MAANKKKATARHTEDTPVKSFLDMIAPSVVQFNPDHFICGNTFRCVWALREYPTQTDEQALLRHLGEKDGITLRIYTRQLTPAEEDRILHNAANKNRMNKSNPNDLRQTIIAETNLQDMISMEGSRHRNKEPLFHCAVYIELTAPDYDALKLLQTDVLTELVRSKLNVDRLLLRQQQGFCCVSPVGYYGLRRSEVLGLRWSAIDMEHKTISISHKVIEAEVDGKFVPMGEDVLKTKSSFRTLPLIPAVGIILLEEKEKQEMYRRLFKKSYCRDYLDYICVDQCGKLLRPNYVTEHFSWLIEKYGLRKVRFHDLRHTCASLLLSNGISMKQIQIWLGHSTFSTTADIYAHLDYSAQEASANAMNGMFNRPEKEEQLA